MSKINYPEKGLMTTTKSLIEECSNSISNARSQADLDVPHRYSRRDYLKDLDNKIDDFKKQLVDIQREIEQADRDFGEVCENAVKRIAKMNASNIIKRIRRVV